MLQTSSSRCLLRGSQTSKIDQNNNNIIIINIHLYTATYRIARTVAVYKLKWGINYKIA